MERNRRGDFSVSEIHAKSAKCEEVGQGLFLNYQFLAVLPDQRPRNNVTGCQVPVSVFASYDRAYERGLVRIQKLGSAGGCEKGTGYFL